MTAAGDVASPRSGGLPPAAATATPSGSPRANRWLNEQWWRRGEDLLALAILAACCIYIFYELQPGLLLRNTTASGGDTGAHVWWPAYLRDHLLPWRVAGWSPDFYAGFPAGQYYFPVSALLIVAIDVVAPYAVAFKLITALGAVLLPIGAYVFARGLRAPNPTPAAFAIAATAFLFFTGDPGTSESAKLIASNQRIMGGNLASTLAGEYSFTLALALALFFFGAFASALRTRRHLWLPATLLALCLMSHLVVGIFALFGAFALWLFHRPLANLGRAVAIGAVGVLISAFWLIPLVATISYTTNMRYGAITEFSDYLFPKYFFDVQGWWPYEWGAYILIAIAIIAAVGQVRRSTFAVLTMTALCGLAFRFWSGLGTHVWNLRLLSFWYIGIYLLMAIGAAEVIRGIGWLAGFGWRSVTTVDRAGDEREAHVVHDPADRAVDDVVDDGADRDVSGDDLAGAAAPSSARLALARVPTAVVAIAVMLALTLGLSIGALHRIDDGKDFIPYWAKWNYSGYENVEDQTQGEYTASCASPPANAGSPLRTLPAEDGTPALCVFARTITIGKQWPEYRALMDELRTLPPGRSLWEGGPSLDKYGTPLALMLIPYWTKGRITTMEGVYFEASATTPYHFEAVAALAAAGQASNPVRGIPYHDQQDFSLGVRYLQVLGVDYFLVHTGATKQLADADPRLRLVGSTPDLDAQEPLGWNIYRVANSPLVEGLAYEPVVAKDVEPGPEGWEQQVAAPWWWFPAQLDKPVVAAGPAQWRHAAGGAALGLPRRPITPVRVRNVETTDDSISFDVDRTGTPVLVKTSYFPNWRVHGAKGPFRATPNFMVVVPTEKHVRLYYGTTHAEWLGRLLTLAGLAGLVALVWWGRRRSRASEGSPGMHTRDGVGNASNTAIHGSERERLGYPEP